MKKKLTQNQKQLIRRYLIWFYKTIKEELDRVDRKFTQVMVDNFVLAQTRKASKSIPASLSEEYLGAVAGYSDYIEKKKNDGIKEKFVDATQKVPQAQYLYLANRLKAVEQAIVFFLSKRELEVIRAQYEEEMTSRILQSKEHR